MNDTSIPILQSQPEPLRHVLSRWFSHHGWYIFIMVALGVILFNKGLYSPDMVLSDAGKDGDTFFYNKYLFVRQWSTWNPYIHCGTPVAGSFQYAFFYPPRIFFMFFPLSLSITWTIFIHVCLAGCAMYTWTVFRGLPRLAALLAGVVFMFSGPYIAHIPVGTFAHLYAIPWIPLVFLGIDGWLRHRKFRYIILAASASALQIFAGFPQYFYYTALFAGVWSLFGLYRAQEKGKAVTGLLAIYPLAIALAAVEILPGIKLMGESVRDHGMSFEAACIGKLPLTNLPLLFAPKIFGGFGDLSWWGAGVPYDTLPYIGVVPLLLALLAWSGFTLTQKIKWLFLTILPLVLAVGIHTPLYAILFKVLPMYSSFRFVSRVLIFFALFGSLLAGMGLYKLMGARQNGRIKIGAISLFSLTIGLALLGSGLLLQSGKLDELFKNFVLKEIPDSIYWRWLRQYHEKPQWWALIQGFFSRALIISSILWLVGSALIYLARRGSRVIPMALAVLAMADITFYFAKPQIRYFPRTNMEYPDIAKFLALRPQDERNINLVHKDSNIYFKTEGAWGYEALLLRRHAALVAASQGTDIDHIEIQRNSQLFQLMRVHYIFVASAQGTQVMEMQNNPLPRFLLIGNYCVMTDPNEILKTLSTPSFDYRRKIILEKDPGLPNTSAADVPECKVNVLSSSATRWVVQIDCSGPGMLLMTDSYAKGWQAKPLPQSVQQDYIIMPADYAMRGIPLTTAGRHLLVIEYNAPGLALGAIITLTTLLALGLYCVCALSGVKFRLKNIFGHWNMTP